MAGDARKVRSKWDTKGPPDIVEISEDESPPMNMDDNCKGGDLLPNQNSTNCNENQFGESLNLKPDTSMHQGSSVGVSKDIKERQSKASSEKTQPPRVTDEHNQNDWGKAGLDKATGNQGLSRYADDGRRGDGWGTALSRGYSSRMSSGPDAWKPRSRSPSPRGGWNRSRRNRSRSRSRSRSIGRARGRSRSRSPYFADRGSEWRVERGRGAPGGPALPCRDFVAGRCRRGSHCRFPHDDGARRQFDEPFPVESRERYGHQSRDFIDPREQNDYLRSRPSRGSYDEGTWERSELRREYRSTELCNDFVKGRCSRGASCRFNHDDSAAHVGWRDEVREGSHGRGGPDLPYGSRTEHRRTNKNPCKFFAEGRCRRGQNCPYLHEEASQSQMGLGAPDEPPNYSGGHAGRGNYSNWGEQSNSAQASFQVLPRDDRENPVSQVTGGNDSRYEYKNPHLKDAGNNQYQIIPQEDFGSQGQNKPEIAVPQQPQFLTSVQTGADSINNDKVSDTDGRSGLAPIGNLSMQIPMHGTNHMGGQNLGQDAIPQNSGAPTLPVTTQFQHVTSSMPLNSQIQQNDFSLHPSRQDQFVVPQAAANNSAPSMQNQPVPPYMGHSHHGYIPGAQALPDLSALHGQNFNIVGQFAQNLASIVHGGQSLATVDIHNPIRDSGNQSIQNTHDYQPVAPNEQTQSQPLQGLSVVPSSSSADMVGAPVSHNAVAPEDAFRLVKESLAQLFGNKGLTPDAAGLQSSQPNLNSSLMNNSSAAPPALQPNQWPWTQQQGMAHPAHAVPSEQPAPQMFQVPMAAGSSIVNPILLPHPVAPAAPATFEVNETVPSENKKGEPKDTDAEAHEDGDNKKSKDSKALKMFKLALAEFVKEALKPTWKEGQLTREIHKTIVKKVVDKVTSTVENAPQTKEKIDIYMSYSKEKLNKLVQAYVGKYAKTT